MATAAQATTSAEPYAFGEQYIDGIWRRGGGDGAIEVRSPYSRDLLASIPKATKADVDAAYVAAEEAQRSWAQTLPSQRADVMRRAAQVMEARKGEILDWLVQEAGSTLAKAEIEWGAVHIAILEASTLPSRVEGRILLGDYPNKENRIYRKPRGVVTVISPWNWPMHLSNRSVVPAIALGNAVVLKPAAETPITGGLIFGKILEEAGLPKGVLNVIVGESSEIGDHMVAHPVPRAISFTGSTPVGRHIGELAVKSPLIKKTMLELGGNAPIVILEDVDLDFAAHVATVGKFLHQGQLCIAINRIIVVDAIFDAFVEKFVERARQIVTGDPADPATTMGPIISQKQFDGLQRMIALARQEGAKELLSGEAKGWVLPPHIFEVTQEMSLGNNEIFGPIAPLLRARDEADAIRLANATEYGLTSAVLTGNLERGARVAKQIEAGMTHVNDIPAIDMPGLPFGGEKNSGLGRFGSAGVIEEFTTEHWISLQSSPSQYPF